MIVTEANSVIGLVIETTCSPPAAAAHSPPLPPPAVLLNAMINPPPPPPAPSKSKYPAPNVRHMSPEEGKVFIHEEAKCKMEECMCTLGVSAPSSSPSLDSSVEDRLAQEQKEAKEKAEADEKQAEKQEQKHKERLEREKALKEGKPTAAPAPSTTTAPMHVGKLLHLHRSQEHQLLSHLRKSLMLCVLLL